MDLKGYFETSRGLGVLATADNKGRVDAAIYARPHVMDDGRLAFIMADRLTHANLWTNPYAVYLFKAEGEGYQGKRLYLKKIGESQDAALISALRRSGHGMCGEESEGNKFLVYFNVEQERPLVGGQA